MAIMMLLLPDPLDKTQLTGRRYSVKSVMRVFLVVIAKSLVASGVGDHFCIEFKALSIPVGVNNGMTAVDRLEIIPVLTNSRMSLWMICFAGKTFGGGRYSALRSMSTSRLTSRSCSSAILTSVNRVTPRRSSCSRREGMSFIPAPSQARFSPEIGSYISSRVFDSGCNQDSFKTVTFPVESYFL